VQRSRVVRAGVNRFFFRNEEKVESLRP
jgi:hypothetical protein